jgi:hypothetical protein
MNGPDVMVAENAISTADGNANSIDSIMPAIPDSAVKVLITETRDISRHLAKTNPGNT